VRWDLRQIRKGVEVLDLLGGIKGRRVGKEEKLLVANVPVKDNSITGTIVALPVVELTEVTAMHKGWICVQWVDRLETVIYEALGGNTVRNRVDTPIVESSVASTGASDHRIVIFAVPTKRT
jgi:hypothetical protein